MKRGCGNRWWWRLVVVGAVLALAAGAAWAEEAETEEEGPAVAPGFSYGVEATASYHYVNHAYFTKYREDLVERQSTTWGEGFTRLRLNYGLPQNAWVSVGGVVMATVSTDYFGTDDQQDGRLDQLAAGISDIGGTGFGVTAGRQDLQVGDGFVIGDGYYDSKAALWNIPLNFYDALRADFARGPWHALVFGARLSPSYGGEGVSMKGQIGGAEAGWKQGDDREVALAYFLAHDTGDADADMHAVSLRGAAGLRGFRLGGELVKEFGTTGDDTDLRGYGGHLELTYKSPLRGEPYAQVQYLLFTGDDPGTEADETYYPWQYRWNDWSQWYVADLMASTQVFNTDARIWKLECGWTPLENTGVRLLLHRLDLDTGASFFDDGLGEVGRGFADEADLVVDQALGENLSLWVMGGLATPRAAAKAAVGDATSAQFFASITYSFAGPGGGD